MGKILDYRCSYDSAAGLGKWAEQNPNLQFPQAYCQAEMMADLAQTIRQTEGGSFCILPFCHTLEAEAYGADIVLGDGLTTPRGRTLLNEIPEKLPPMNRKAPRLLETIAAIKLLKERGEKVLFQLSGPLTILNNLYSSEKLFRLLLKDGDRAMDLFRSLREDMIFLMKAAEDAGADVLSYADPMAAVNLVGPKIAEKIARDFTAGFLHEVNRRLKAETLFLLCPKTSFALIGTELAVWKEHPLEQKLTYDDAALALRGKVRFGGQCCVKAKEKYMDSFRELQLLEEAEE